MSEKAKKATEKVALKQEQTARRRMLDELFHDWYIDRKRIYWMNLMRGIFFGVGSLLGGTIVVALLLWLLSVLGGAPIIGDFFVEVSDTIEEGTNG